MWIYNDTNRIQYHIDVSTYQ